MTALLLPALAAVLLWWVSTGLVLWLVRRPERAFGPALAIGIAPALAAAVVLAVAAREATVAGAYLGFGAALVIWGWHEAAFLTGHAAGPRRTPCPPHASGWTRFRAAAETLIWHELALLATAVVTATLTWGAPDQTGVLTFLLLLVLRLSTKLNLYAGVPNPPAGLLPERLAHLGSYFRRRPLDTPLLLSTAGAGALACWLTAQALGAPTGGREQTGLALLAALAALGFVEHLFLAAPSPERLLWGWALGDRHTRPTPALAGPKRAGRSGEPA
jgi:putative photosynthetic complex assembly protein 2